MDNREIWTQCKRDVSEQNIRFQPVICVLHDQKPNRLECLCGALATFVNIELSEDGRIEALCVNCHDCYCKEDERGNKDEHAV